MKTKDQIAKQYYNSEYVSICGDRKRTVDDVYRSQKKPTTKKSQVSKEED